MDVYSSTDGGATFSDVLNRDTSTAGGKLNKIILGNAFFGYDSGTGKKLVESKSLMNRIQLCKYFDW